MAIKLPDNFYVNGTYLDANVVVTDINGLLEKISSNEFFLGMAVKMPEAFYGKNELPYPIDFWSTPYGEDIKWEIKTMPSIESEEDLERFKFFVEDFKKELEYYPMPIGFEFLANGEKYVFDIDENEAAVYTAVQTSMDDLINHTVELAVDDAVNKITSGASEAFDTLKEVEEWIKENSGKTADLTGYVKQEDLEGYVKREELPSMEEYATKDYVDGKVGEIVIPTLDGYATEAWVGEQGFLTEHQDITGKQDVIDDLETIREGASKGATALQEVPEGYATETWVGEQGFLTEHQDISGLATKEEVSEAIASIEIPSVEGLATETWVSAEIAKAQLGGEDVDLSGYATKDDIKGLATKEETEAVKTWVAEQGFLTEHQSLEGLATEQFVTDRISEIQIPSVDGFATEAWVNEQGFLTEHQDITGKQDVIDDLEVIREGAAKGATALQEVPEGYATEAWVGEQGFLTEHQDISGKQDIIEDLETIREGAAKGATALQEIPEEYITNEELEAKGYLTEHQDLSGYAKKEEIPTLEGYATESWVSAEIAKAQLEGEDVDLSGYATKDDIKGLASEQFVTDEIAKIEIPTLDGYATESWVNEQGFLTEHQDISGKQDIIEDLETIREGAAKGATALQSVPEGYATETWVGEQGFLTEHQDITGKQDVIEDLEVIREGASKGATALQEVPEGYATEAWVGEQGFLTEHQDISGLATKEEVANAIAEIEIPSVEGLATEQFVIDEIAKIEIPEIDNLATKEELANVSGSIKTVIEDLLIPENAKESLDTLEEISAWIQSHPEDAASMNAQITALTESAHTHENKDILDAITAEKVAAWDVAEANASAYTDTEIEKLSDVYAKTTDLEGLATETWVSAEIAKAQLEGEDVDLSGYATKDDLNSLATKEETEAVKTWVGEQGFLTEHQDISGKQDIIEDLETIREGAAKGATALQSVPEGYATETWVGEQGFLTEHQDISGLATKEEVANAIAEIEIPTLDGYATEAWVNEQGFLTEHQNISGLATKEEVSEAVLSAKTYADSLVDNLKPYSGGTAVDVTDYTVNVNVAEDGFLEVNEENELTVTGVTLDAAVTSKDIIIEGGAWESAVKAVFTGGTVPAGTTWESFLESMLCVEKFANSISTTPTFTVSCGNINPGISKTGTVEVGTKVVLNETNANITTASQSLTVKTFAGTDGKVYGYKLGEDGVHVNASTYTETLEPILKNSSDALKITFTKFTDAINNGSVLETITGNTVLPSVEMYAMEGTNKVIVSQTGDTYTSSSAVTAGTIYIATNLKNYYKTDKQTPNTYVPTFAVSDKTASDSTEYTVTGAHYYYIGDVMDYSADYWDTDRSEMIRNLGTKGWANVSTITKAHTFGIGTKQQTVVVPSKYTNVSGKDVNNGDVKFNLVKTFDFTNGQGYISSYNIFVAPSTDGLGSDSKITITIK